MPYQHEFPQKDGLVYLNHAAVAPWPQRSYAAIEAFSRENVTFGATHYPQWMKTEQQLRERLKTLLNASSSDEIALQKNTSEALSVIAYGIDWQAGDEIIISDEEFPSNRIVWESLAQYGVKLLQINLEGPEPEQNLLNAITGKTRLLAISSVQYASGIALDLSRLGAACKQQNILFCVDAIQSLGVLPMDVDAINADFVVADGHKWLLGPEGLAVFYCRHTRQEQLKLHQYGWHMLADAGNYTTKTWRSAENARRFECGSPNMLAAHALNASLGLLLEVGVDVIEGRVRQLSHYLRKQLQQEPDIKLLSPQADRFTAGITTFHVEGVNQQALYQALMKAEVICANRGGGIRFSPHFYQTEALLDEALVRLRHCIKACG
ncbi:MAG: aminotransferase class V-fold PLP-dependent enzyme [Oceanospirillaceae bacterium]|nr:aminotransferase class V-fold PLP-dependent enzyme [Oceanospirillaceae bacterium]MCP5349411.1 aminotransferase class V-fold PLP-dependent enzyme [Oceanospirillaceae bacterium]